MRIKLVSYIHIFIYNLYTFPLIWGTLVHESQFASFLHKICINVINLGTLGWSLFVDEIFLLTNTWHEEFTSPVEWVVLAPNSNSNKSFCMS